jgi:hypothetical protein
VYDLTKEERGRTLYPQKSTDMSTLSTFTRIRGRIRYRANASMLALTLRISRIISYYSPTAQPQIHTSRDPWLHRRSILGEDIVNTGVQGTGKVNLPAVALSSFLLAEASRSLRVRTSLS